MKNLYVAVRKGVPTPVYLGLAGRVTDKHVSLLHSRDWQVFTVKGYQHPLIRVWGDDENHLFVMQMETLPSQAELHAWTERIHDRKWIMDHDHLKGVKIPLVVHEKFVMVISDNPGITLPVESVLALDKPWLIWLEDNSGDIGHPLVIATLH